MKINKRNVFKSLLPWSKHDRQRQDNHVEKRMTWWSSYLEILNPHRQETEAVVQRCSVKKSVFRNFAKCTGKHLCQCLFFNKVAGLGLWPCFLDLSALLRICFVFNNKMADTFNQKSISNPQILRALFHYATFHSFYNFWQTSEY